MNNSNGTSEGSWSNQYNCSKIFTGASLADVTAKIEAWKKDWCPADLGFVSYAPETGTCVRAPTVFGTSKLSSNRADVEAALAGATCGTKTEPHGLTRVQCDGVVR